MVCDLGWVDFRFGCSTVCPNLIGQMGICQLAEQIGNMVEHPNPCQINPGLRPHETPCSLTICQTESTEGRAGQVLAMPRHSKAS